MKFERSPLRRAPCELVRGRKQLNDQRAEDVDDGVSRTRLSGRDGSVCSIPIRSRAEELLQVTEYVLRQLVSIDGCENIDELPDAAPHFSQQELIFEGECGEPRKDAWPC